MNKKLKKVTDEWMQLERKTFEQRKIADKFYDDNLMKLIEDDYKKRNKDMVFEKVEYLVVSVGTSYEPIVLNISLLNPANVIFLYTKVSAETLNKVIEYCNLKPTDYEKRLVESDDPTEIYREVKRAYLMWNKPECMYIDVTGGTKIMSSAAAMAGGMIDIQLVYVGTDDYMVDFRKPRPGSESIRYIDNPLAVFGDLEVDKAFELFDSHNFSGAAEKLEVLKECIPDPEYRQELNFVYLLSRAYEEWDSLDFVPAYESMFKLDKELKRDRRFHPKFLMMDYVPQIEKQLSLLTNLKDIPALIKDKRNMDILTTPDLINSLMFTMYANARTRENQEKYDMATLLMYRLLEMIEQRRLAKYNLYVSKMDYMNMRADVKQVPEMEAMDAKERFALLKEKVYEIKKELFKNNASSFLPEQVSLLEGFIILEALGDSITKAPDGKNINILKSIRAKVLLRNNSIFAHGLGPVDQRDYVKFRDFVTDMFIKYTVIEKIDFQKYANDIKWLSPSKSLNYVTKEE